MNNKLTTFSFMLVGVLGVAVPGSARAQSATFTFDTQQSPNPQFAPNNIVAVWIETPAGKFVRTLAQWAATRKQYLLAWNTSSKGNNVDAVTGATFTAHGTRTVSWDLRDVNKTVVPNGTYVVKMELADRNATQTTQNNEASFTFTVGQTPVNMMTSGGGFNKVMINYSPTATVDMAGPPPTDASTGTPDGSDGGTGGGGSAPSGCSVAPLGAASGELPLRGLGLGVGLFAVLRRRRRTRAAQKQS